YLYEGIAPEAAHLIRLSIGREGGPHAFREYAEQFVARQNTVRTLLAGHHSAELGNEIRDEGKLEEARVGQVAGDSPCVLQHQVKSHHRIPWNEAAMRAHHDGPALPRDVFETFGFDAPVATREKLEHRPAEPLYVAAIHTEVVEFRSRFSGPLSRMSRTGLPACARDLGARLPGNEP